MKKLLLLLVLLAIGALIAKKVRDEAMRCLMKCYGDDHGYRPDRRKIYYVTAHSLDFWLALPNIALLPKESKRRALRARASGRPMSALGQKRTSGPCRSMSALPPQADIAGYRRHVR